MSRYGGLGDRHQQNGVNYTLDLNAGLTQVLSDGTNTYLYGNGRIAQTDSTTEYFLGDALGSVRQLVDSAGAVTLTQSYAPYGEIVSSTGSGTSAYQFTGEMRDANGLTYLRARYLDSSTGRFTQRDPSGLEANLYLYAGANPVNRVDPTGLFSNSQIAHSLGVGDFDGMLNWFEYHGDERFGFLALLMDAKEMDVIAGVSLEEFGQVTAYPLGQFLPLQGCEISILAQGKIYKLSEYIERLPVIAKQSGNLVIPWWRSVVNRYGLNWQKSYRDTHYTDLPDFYAAGKGLEIGDFGGKIFLIKDRFGYEYVGFSIGAGPGISLSVLEYQEGYVQGLTREWTTGTPISLTEEELRGAISGFSIGLSYNIFLDGTSGSQVLFSPYQIATYSAALVDLLSVGVGGDYVIKIGPSSTGWNYIDNIPYYDRTTIPTR